MKRVPGLLPLALLGALIGCSDEPATGPDIDVAPQVRTDRHAQPWTFDEEFTRIAREEIPGFAGYYIDPNGKTVIWLVDPQYRDAAARLTAQERRRMNLPLAQATIIRAARYDFAILKQWYDALASSVDGEAIFWLDIDEVRNRLYLAVADEQARSVARYSSRSWHSFHRAGDRN